MPRIAMAVAVVVTVGLSIGINIARFPAVWEMVNSPGVASASPPIASPSASFEPGSAADLSRMAPPGSLGAPPLDAAGPIRVAESAPIATEDKSDKPGSSEPLPQGVPARLVSAGQPEAETPKDSPSSITAPSSNVVAGGEKPQTGPSPGTSQPAAAVASGAGCLRGGAAWPAEASPAIKYATNRPIGGGPPDAYQPPTERPLVPVVWPDSPAPKANAPVLSTVSTEVKLERLPPVGKEKPIPKEDSNRTPGGPIPVYPSTGR
jgi:hypothetical protein